MIENAVLSQRLTSNDYTLSTAPNCLGWLTKDLPALADRLGNRRLLADYEAGDMVVHGAHTTHAATTNASPEGRIRLSTDIRYQRVKEEIDVRWSNHWSFDDFK